MTDHELTAVAEAVGVLEADDKPTAGDWAASLMIVPLAVIMMVTGAMI